MVFDEDRGYFYGVLLGDGHIAHTERLERNERGRGPFLFLKVCDLDMIETWRDAIERITGFRYKISKHNPGTGSGARRQQYKLRLAHRELTAEAERLTCHKDKIPQEILSGNRETQIAFARGLMDSEGWINFYLAGGIGQCDMTLGFGCGDAWFEDFYQLVGSLGVKTSKIYNRPHTVKKNGENGKTLRLFKMDIPSFVQAGLGFSIKRKQDRLMYCLRILNDYTRDYPKYEDYDRVEDIVWPAAKVAD